MGGFKNEERSNVNVEKMKPMCIPDYILEMKSVPNNSESEPAPDNPIIVFVNSKSGGQLGSAIIKSFRALLNPKQVYDLAGEQPGEVLHHLLGHLEKLKEEGDSVATHVRTHMRIIVAGGDGTHGWLLGVIGDLKLEHPPPVATMPLGTGNNLPFSFGWGKKNPGTSVSAMRKFILEVVKATPLHVDSWHVTLKMALVENTDALEPVKVPHSLHSFHRILDKKEEDQQGHREEGRITFRGGFWNYFSIGMDAQVAYEFHSNREKHPERFKKQIMNQAQYAMLTCWQGWFCAPCFHPSSKNIPKLAKIKVANHNEPYRDLEISRRIRSIVVLNLPSFSGGLNPWGSPSDEKSTERGLTAPFVDDGLLEIVGFTDAWHGTVLFAPNGHGVRLAQAHKMKIEFHSGAADETYLRLDGEPWKQPLPNVKKPSTIEITQLGQSLVLVTKNALAKADSRSPPIQPAQEVGAEENGENWREDQMTTGGRSSSLSSVSDNEDMKRKFGAANTFKSSVDAV